VLYVKKNMFSDKNSGKSSKGFYAALGISILMIGSACYFAYNEGEKLSEDNFTAQSQSSVSEEAVDKKYTDIPKSAVTTVITTTALPATEAQTEATHIATLPAAAIVVDEPPAYEEVSEEIIPETEAAAETAADKLANITAPLEDMSSVVNPFSGTELVKNETTGSWQTHNGCDIAAEIGAEVYAISSGEVTAVNDDPLWGTAVVIDHHNGYISRYYGLDRNLAVQAGDVLASGDVIGTVGDTADIESALASHLHIEITHNGSYLDPMTLFDL
jgi:murein DD-endopeptidase MepM/ murein hydrolase activator NlpD